MATLTGKSFKNSATCEGVAFAADAPVDLAEITLDGRYPEAGWARNLESHEIVRVLRGVGSLALKDGVVTRLHAGDVVHIPPEEWFAWSGDMTLLMACSPPFSQDQYEVKEDA